MRRRFGVALLALAALALSAGTTRADVFQTFDLTWSGASFGNTATATGTITLDLSKVNNPGVTSQGANSFVTDFSITISGASSGNGTFGFSDFNGSPGTGGFVLVSGSALDFNQDLVGQSGFATFNIFSNVPSAPFGVGTSTIGTSGGRGDLLLLTSFAPAAVAVPEPSTLALLGLGTVGVVVWRLRRRRTA